MTAIPAVGFAAYSGTGKTTLIEKLVRRYAQQGLRVAVIKHDGHDFEIDREGKDSMRFAQAGALVTVIGSGSKTATIEQRERSLQEILDGIEGVDLILVEGYKHADLPKIGISRRACGKGLTAEPSSFIALVTDEAVDAPEIPHFLPDEDEAIAAFILRYAGLTREGTPNEEDFTHFNEQGRAKMVDVGEKEPSHRTATAGARVLVSRQTFEMIRSGGMKKGDVLTVAQIAGVMGAKRTPDLIPMCHPILISGIDLTLSLDEARCAVDIRATVSCDGKTGVEMEALTAASTAALTVYDMCKAVQKDMVITDVRLIRKTGGVHGDFIRREA